MARVEGALIEKRSSLADIALHISGEGTRRKRWARTPKPQLHRAID